MVEKYVPKVGDKVRATLGENVLVGIVTVARLSETQDYFEVDVAGFDVISVDDSWHFEQVVSVPTKFGAVIRRADGLISFLADLSGGDSRWWTPGLGWGAEVASTRGGFSVLFDGVDE